MVSSWPSKVLVEIVNDKNDGFCYTRFSQYLPVWTQAIQTVLVTNWDDHQVAKSLISIDYKIR